MNKTKKQSRKLMLICIPVMLAVALVVGFIWSYSRTHSAGMDISDASVYETRYCKLYYPESWADRVRVEIQDDTASFISVTERGDEYPLFDVLFQQEEGVYLGDLKAGNGETVSVSIVSYDPGKITGFSPEEVDTHYAMLEDVNYLIDRLPLLEPEEEAVSDQNENVPEEVTELPDIVIETAYGKLYYPGSSNTQLRTEEQGNIIAFYASAADLPELHLFDLCFDAPEKDAQGYVELNGEKHFIDIYFYDIQEDPSWSQEQLEALWAAQEGINHLIAKLGMVYLDMPGNTATEDADTEQLTIQTPYCEISYPAEWEAYLVTTVTEAEGYTVSFAANMPGKEPVALFDIIFGGSSDLMAGKLARENGELIPVAVRMSDFVLDDSWTMEEQNMVYEMAELLNDILQQLPLTQE